MNIVLISPSDHSQGCEYVYAGRENLGVEYLLAVLRNHGFHATSLNENIVQDDFEGVMSSADLVGFSLPFWDYREKYVDLIQKVARRFKGKLIAGGHAATIGAEYFLQKCPTLNGIVMGEGEETIIQLVKRLTAKENIDNLSGFYTRSGFEKRALGSIDTLPFPARDELELILGQERSVKEAYISTTRGCHNACSFCSIPPYYKLAHGPRWRERSTENVCGEIEELLSNYPTLDSVSFVDDNFLGFNPVHKERGLSIAKCLHIRKSTIAFELTCRVDSVDYELFGRLAEYGLSGVYLGIESGVQRILDLFKKNTTVEKNLQAIDTISRLGLGCDIGFIMFCPTITLDEVEENLYFLRTIIERFGVYVHPAVVFRSLKTYPSDLGVAALISSSDATESIRNKTSLLYSTMNSIWQANYEAKFLKLEHDLLFPSESMKNDIPQTFEFTLNMIDIGLRLIKELRKHDTITAKGFSCIASCVMML